MSDTVITGEFQDHWLEFLRAWKAGYSKVEQAAKDNARELQWFGAVKKERRADPLLRYLFEARNDEEHGLTQSAIARPARAIFRATKDVPSARLIYHEGKIVDVVGRNGESVAEFSLREEQETSLRPVKDRGGNVIPPPTSHFDKPMEPMPHPAPELGLQYLEALIATAEAMSTP